MFDHGFSVLDDIMDRTSAQWAEHLTAGGCDDSFVEQLMKEFVSAGRQTRPGAGSAHMALSVVKLVRQRREIEALREKVSVLEAALQLMFDIDDL